MLLYTNEMKRIRNFYWSTSRTAWMCVKYVFLCWKSKRTTGRSTTIILLIEKKNVEHKHTHTHNMRFTYIAPTSWICKCTIYNSCSMESLKHKKGKENNVIYVRLVRSRFLERFVLSTLCIYMQNVWMILTVTANNNTVIECDKRTTRIRASLE